MPTIPLFQYGRHLTSVILTPQVVDTAGVLTNTTTTADILTLTAVMEGLEETSEPDKEEINALNSTRKNMVILADGWTLKIDCLKVNNSTDPSPLRTVYRAYDNFLATWIEGTGGSQKTRTFYGNRGTHTGSFQGRGRQVASIQLDPIDIGSAQVS